MTLRPLAPLLASAALAAPAASAGAQSPAQLAPIEQALERSDQETASERILALAAERRAAGAPRSDPLINGLAGRLYLAAGLPAFAIPFLERADDPAVPPGQRVESLLALAEAQSRIGAPEAAAAALARLEREALSPEQRRRLRLLAAEAGLAADPRAALAQIGPLLADADAATRFEAELLAGRAYFLLGDRPAAAAAAGRAWAGALALPPELYAPLRAMLVQAALAAAAGNRESLLEMLNLAGARAAPVDDRLSSHLPVCGEDGITEADHVVVAAYASAYEWQRTMLVSASRSQAAATFMRRLGARDLLDPDGHWPLGTIITLRCRTIAGADYEPLPMPEPYARLYAEHGVYMPAGARWNAARVAALEAELERRSAALGADHPDLIPLLAELSQRIDWRMRNLDVPDKTELAAIQRRFTAAIRRLPGAEMLTPTDEELELADSPSPQTLERQRALWRRRVERSDLDLAYLWALYWLRSDSELPPAQARDMVEGLLARFEARTDDPRRRALLMRLGRVRNELGDFAGARAAYRAAGAPEDSCLVRHLGLERVSGEIDPDLYPTWALRYELVGRTIIEFDVAADGRTRAERVVVSAPSTIFDAAARRGFAAYRHAPANPDGSPRDCVGSVQSITWRLAEPDDSAPDASPFSAGPP